MLLFLQALIPERKITSIIYTSEESTNQNPDGKSIRVDVECTDADGQCFVGIMRFSLNKESDQFLYRYSLMEDSTGQKMTDDLHYIFLEVPKCKLTPESSLIEKVGWALYTLPTLKEKPKGLEGEIFDLLFTSANLSNFTAEDKIKYHNDMTTERDIRNQIAFARDKGLEEGITQRNEEIAKAMLAEGFDAATILKFTGLTAEQLSALK